MIGESNHSEIAGKKILIDNMANLKKAGVTHIFLEHVLDDTQGDLLEKYCSGEIEEMPIILKDYLHHVDESYHISETRYTFTNLVAEAKKNGIKIIPIDTAVSYSTDSRVYLGDSESLRNRYLMMNYVAAKQIEKIQKKDESFGKCIIFCGSGHSKAIDSDVPGVTDITGCPLLVVEDARDNKKQAILLSPSQHIAKPDVLIILSKEKVQEEAIGVASSAWLFANNSPQVLSDSKVSDQNEPDFEHPSIGMIILAACIPVIGWAYLAYVLFNTLIEICFENDEEKALEYSNC